MTSQALDYSAELAERAYRHSKVPNKAAKAHTAFVEHLDEVKETVGVIAKTERQRDVLDQRMVNYHRGYISRLSNVLQLDIDKQFTRAQEAQFSFSQWQRKEHKAMRDDILNVERPNARWADRVEQPVIVGGRSA
jgi:hypothetical protein